MHSLGKIFFSFNNNKGNTLLGKSNIDLFVTWEMLTDALKVIVNNPFKENFYRKRKEKKRKEKKTINILTVFFTFHKSRVKTFLK